MKLACSAAGMLVLAVITACQAVAPGAPAAERIYMNARVYTVEESQSWAEAVAVADGRIVAVGSSRDVMTRRGPATEIVDLGGRLLMPSFADIHVHPVFGGMSYSRCSLHAGTSLEEYQRMVAGCIAETPGNGVIYGVGWGDALFPPKGVPRKEVLDAVSRDRPLIFESVGGHSYWLNSAALKLAGIDKDTPDPPNGHIDRDPTTGEPVGGLQEAAMALVDEFIPKPTQMEIENSILYVANHFNALGITSWHDAGVEFAADGTSPTLDAYGAVRDRGELTSWVNIALKWQNENGLEQIPALLQAAERARAMGLRANTVKFYLDGVIPQQTAAMLEPYENSGDARGTIQIPYEVLETAVKRLDARGMQIYVHAIGDRAVRQALDAIAAARAANGDNGVLHLIAHLNVVDHADQPRFGALGVAAQFQPLWASEYPYMDLTQQAIGPVRSRYIYPANSILRAGGVLAYGADWPVASANPLEGLEVAVTRRTAGRPDAEPLLPEEGVTLEQAVRAYTIDVARVNRLDSETGSIAPGKSADLIVLDRNIFEIPIYEVSQAKVLLTLFRGQPVHGKLARFDR